MDTYYGLHMSIASPLQLSGEAVLKSHYDRIVEASVLWKVYYARWYPR